MRSALSSFVGGAPGGTVTVGAVPAVPTGERSAGGMGAMVLAAPLPGVVVAVGPTVSEFDEFDEFAEFAVVDVFELDGLDGAELHAARASPATTPVTSATARGRR